MYCCRKFNSIASYMQHQSLHRNEEHIYRCPHLNCDTNFRILGSLKAHLHYKHSIKEDTSVIDIGEVDLNCTLTTCHHESSSVKQATDHLNYHLSSEGVTSVKCPYLQCNCSFKNASSFRSHLHRKHKNINKYL